MINKKIKKVLIANRGGVVNRISLTCKSLGIKTVSIFGLQDTTSPYIYQTDEAYQINKDGYSAYLDQNKIIEIALESKVDAIHPGYGFLSENHSFAQKVVESGLAWIGPSPDIIRLMGDKNEARLCAKLAGVPTTPGVEFDINTDFGIAQDKALEVGFPLILKDPLGGGGKAARRVNKLEDFENALRLTISEAQNLTGTTKILIEKYLINPRHIEIQIAGDGKNYVHLFERDCSIQRRYQKIIEETPCNFVSKDTLEKMYSSAIKLAKVVGYTNIGTVEFMVTPEEEFFFLEMNTRLQVEHSVTEITTGIDLVEMQIYITENGRLPVSQASIKQRGHAIECRIYSEDSANNFSPCTGVIEYLQIPNVPNIRLDHDLELNKEITPFFDPMQAQLSVYGNSRKTLISSTIQALESFVIGGIKTNINFLENLIKTEEFKNGRFHTQFLTTENIERIHKMVKSVDQSKLSCDEIGVIAGIIIQELQYQKPTNPAKSSSNLPNYWRAQQWS